MALCECGCRREAKKGNRFLHGHHGRVRSKEVSESIRQAIIDRWADPVFREYIGAIQKSNSWKISESLKKYYRLAGSREGTAAPNYRGKNYAYSAFFGRMKKIILKRDGYCCKICGVEPSKRVHDVHHINCDEFDHSSFNLITLCMSCHRSLHSSGWARDFDTQHWLHCLIRVKYNFKPYREHLTRYA